MLKGKIKHLNKSFGFIKPTAGGKDVFFHKSSLQGVEFGELKEGMVVQYEWESGRKDRRAVSVRIANPPPEKNRQSPEYRFINPYNFVRFLDKARPSSHVLGDCPPPPQDRYIGLTGRITCEVVTKTSLFISDSHNIQQDNEGHKSYRFFQYDGQQALPASSLRGMIRSIFETITNSCFAAFQKDDLYQSLLPKHLFYCNDYNRLCPACRVFGWVSKNSKNDDLKKTTAYAGRVRFSHGTIKVMRGTEQEITLDILSSPKPTATEFYLLDSSGNTDPQVDYDKNAKLRGRKFYHHHGQIVGNQIRQKSNQNRTVRDALKPGTTFSFKIDFENLNRLELGALVYALEFGEGMYHRLGYAKPLGFGSVKISVERLEMVNWQERLTSVSPKSGWELMSNSVSDLKKEFLSSMRRFYGEEQIVVLQTELKAVLGKQNLPIHYPRSTSQFHANRPSFEWFVGNKVRKRPGRRELPEPEALPLATEIEKGLPLIDKSGRHGQ